ncbi:hypothetical protein [Luteimonas huabeiensis]|uniref:hypothetical protein n=1 Tax=Luteimonas huabeiensis TaxID=1244513 RepID=UPI000464B6E1|nr:hypothetical protein [Luteimonas huabeiensis]
MEQAKKSKECPPRHAGGTDRSDRLEQLIGQMERHAPQGTALDTQGAAPQSTCIGRLYCF